MSILLNKSIWGSNEQIIKDPSSQLHVARYFPYYVATDDYFNEHKSSVVNIRKAAINKTNNDEQSYPNEIIDYSICSWSIPAAAAINNIYYIASFYKAGEGRYAIDMAQVSVNDETAYPAFFVGNFGAPYYITVGTESTVKSNYNNLVDIQSDFFGQQIGNSKPSNDAVNTPLVSFGYKSPINFVLVTCCTEQYFNKTQEYGDFTYGKPSTINNGTVYGVPVYQYFHGELDDGTPVSEAYPIIMNVYTLCNVDIANEQTETATPNRALTPSLNPNPMPLIKMISLREQNANTYWQGKDGGPWYNWNNFYCTASGTNARLLLGMSYASGNYEFSRIKDESINSVLGYLGYATDKDRKKTFIIPYVMRSHDAALVSKEVSAILYYGNDLTNPLLRFGYKGLTEREVCREAAYLGLWFCTEDYKNKDYCNFNLYNLVMGSAPENVNLDTICLPQFDDHKVTTGNYFTGTQIKDNPDAIKQQTPNVDWGWRFNLDPEYTFDPDYRPPKPGPEPGDKDDKNRGDIITSIRGTRFVSGCDYYTMTNGKLLALIQFVNSSIQGEPDAITSFFKGRNPIDYITSVIEYPFDVPHTSTKDVVLGGIPVKLPGSNTVLWSEGEKQNFVINLSSTEGQPLQSGILDSQNTYFNNIYDFGTLPITPFYNDFRDMPPFSTAELQLPWAGNYQIDLTRFMGHNIGIKYFVDYPTGAGTVGIFLDDLLVDTINTTLGVSVPLSGIAQGDYTNSIHNLGVQLENNRINNYQSIVNGFIGATSSLVGLDIGGTVSAGTTAGFNLVKGDIAEKNTQYQLANIAPTISTIGTASPKNSFQFDRQPRLIIWRPRYADHFEEQAFGTSEGFACCLSGRIFNFKGFTVCDKVQLDFWEGPDTTSMTKTEADEIVALMRSGVYLNVNRK